MILTFGSLFAGIGGFDLGLERAGMTCAWQVEIDPYCQAVLAKHWPDVPRYEDVRNVGSSNLEPVDLICGGSPCQDVSVAGKREGLAGERSGLWFEFHRILAELEPRWFVFENVPGLLSSNGGRDFATILQGVVQLGYRVCWRILDAQYFGVAQRRRRVFLVGHLGDGRAAQVLFERESSAWDSAPSRETGARVADPITASFAKHRGASAGKDGYPHSHIVAPTLTNHHPRQNGTDEALIAYTIQTNDGGGHKRQDRPNGGMYVKEADAALTVGSSDQTFVAYGVSENQRAELRLTPYSRQITSGGGKPGQGYPAVMVAPTIGADIAHQAGGHPGIEEYTHAVHSNGFGVRRLTPTECERLQAFPDGHTSGQSDTQRYRQLGNAVCVANSEWIGRRILEVSP